MAVQDRRGDFEDFKPEKLKSGEWATVLRGDPNAADGRATYKCYEPGVVKRMATFEDMRENIEAATDEISTEYLKTLTEATQRADTSAANADTKAGSADIAAQNAQAVADTVQAKLDNGELKGDKGDTATIQIGTVETGEPETEVEISNSGTANDAILNFKIPQGKKGDTGTAENLSDQAVNFTAASADTDIVSGEPLKTIFGKLVKSIQTLRTGLAGKAAASHIHSASSITSGTLPVSRGGTGQTTTSGIKTSFGIAKLEKLLTARNKVLYESSTGWTTGSITVQGISNYDTIKIETTNGRTILCYRRNDAEFYGTGGLAAWSGGAMVSVELCFTQAGEKLTKSETYCNFMTHGYSGSHGAKTPFPAIGKIVGVEPIPEKIL